MPLVMMIQTMHPACVEFKPDTSTLQRWWYRATKRMDLERENLSYRGAGYIGERYRRTLDIAQARIQIAFDDLSGKTHSNGSRVSMPYVLERLAIEHDRALHKYQPRPYSGDVVLFRASKQLSGLVADTSLGWKDVVTGALEVCEVPGHQQNILIEPNVKHVAAEMEIRLLAAQKRESLKVS